jgi:hypothetical protein
MPDGWAWLENYYKPRKKRRGQKESGLLRGRFQLQRLLRSYFGVGVVVPPELFLPFLPPLWALLVLVAPFLAAAAGVGLGFAACANAKLPVNNIANTTVASFFIPFSPLKVSVAELLNIKH